MLHKTRAIIINYIKYSESSIITKIFTENFGLQSYIINGVRSEKAKIKIALFQPLTLLEIVVYPKKQGQNISRIAEAKCEYIFVGILADFKKTAIATFISEILHKTLQEDAPDAPFFNFLTEAILFLDNPESNEENFSLQFLLKMASFLGFLPENMTAIFEELHQQKAINMRPESFAQEANILQILANTPFQANFSLKSSLRRELVDYMLLFYRINLDNFGTIKSLGILREILK